MWCSRGLVLRPLLFIIYLNYLSKVWKIVEIVLFRDATNIEAIRCSIKDVASDLKKLNDRLFENILVSNFEKKNNSMENVNPL